MQISQKTGRMRGSSKVALLICTEALKVYHLQKGKKRFDGFMRKQLFYILPINIHFLCLKVYPFFHVKVFKKQMHIFEYGIYGKFERCSLLSKSQFHDVICN